jgi:hypothetical protein
LSQFKTTSIEPVSLPLLTEVTCFRTIRPIVALAGDDGVGTF